MIEAKDVSCTFARNPFSKEGFMAVSPVSIQFIDGERYAIVGESGSGKTTLARMIAGLQRPTTGNIYVDGMPVYGKQGSYKLLQGSPNYSTGLFICIRS